MDEGSESRGELERVSAISMMGGYRWMRWEGALPVLSKLFFLCAWELVLVVSVVEWDVLILLCHCAGAVSIWSCVVCEGEDQWCTAEWKRFEVRNTFYCSQSLCPISKQ